MNAITKPRIFSARQMRSTAALLVLGTSLFGSPLRLSSQESAPPVKDRANLLILNALQTPKVSMKIDGKEVYPDLRPGDKTSGGSTESLKALYEIKDAKTNTTYSENLKLEPFSFQSLILIGDFSIISPQQTGIKGLNDSDKDIPNISFVLLSHDPAADKQGFRYRFVNACLQKKLLCQSKGDEDLEILPGKIQEYTGRSTNALFQLSSGAEKLPLNIRQEKPFHNVTFVITDSSGKLSYYVIPEENAQTLKDREFSE